MSSTLAADCHLHAHWPQRYPYNHPTGSRVDVGNVAASADSLFPTLTAHGVTHTLIIQPGAYGSDNRAMLDAIAGSHGRAKGIAGIAFDASDEVFEELKRGGIVGTRLSLITSDSKAFDRPEIDTFLARCREHDFFVEVFAAAATWPSIMPKLTRAGVRLIVEHVGWPNIPEGTQQTGFQSVLEIGRSTQAAIKISGGFRLTQAGTPYDDVKPFVAEVVKAFGPDRCIWGSDWPLLNPDHGPVRRPFPWKLDYATEQNSLSSWVPDEGARRAILWETPARMFGFAAA